MEVIDRSVWYEQVDKALKTLLTNHFNNVFCSKPIGIVIRTPEKEFTQSDCPCISIYGMENAPSYERDSCEVQLVGNFEGIDCIVPKAKPVDLTYSIDFWTPYKSDMNKISLEWKAFFTPEKVFKVIRADGVEQPCYFKERKTNQQDLTTDGKRLFHFTSIITVHGIVDMFIPEPYTKPKQVQINTKEVNNYE